MKAAAKIRKLFFTAIFAAASLFWTQNSVAQAPKAVSLDFCADQYLLSLAGPDQIMAVSKLATDENSYHREKAAGLDQFGGTVEEILTMRPDVVIGTDWAFQILPVLNHYGIETNVPDYGHHTDILFNNITQFGAVLEQSSKAKKIIDDYKNRLKTLETLPRSDFKVAYITPSGFTGGTGTYINDIIKLAGFASLAEDNGTVGWQPISLEQLLLNPPDMIVSSFFDQNTVHVSHWSLTRHPKINQMMSEIPNLSIPGNLISCGGLFSIEIAEYIRNHGENALNREGKMP